MVHFKNIQTPLTIDKEITIFNVSDVSANKMFNIISQLRNQSKISQSESENDFYIYKLNLDLNLKIKMQKTNISHTSKLDIYLTKNLERYEDQQSQLTIALKNHLNQSKFDLNNLKLTFENINSKKDLQKKIMEQINKNNENELKIRTSELKNEKLPILDIKDNATFKKLLSINSASNLKDELYKLLLQQEDFEILNPNLTAKQIKSPKPDTTIILGKFDFVISKASYAGFPLNEINLEKMKLTSINTTFNNKFGEMTTILIAYFKYWKVIKEQKVFEIPTEIWDKFADNNKMQSNNEVKTIFDEAMTNYLNKLKDNEDTNDNLELLNTIKLDITGDETSSDNTTYQSILKNASTNLQISYFKFIISDEEPLIYQIENYDAKMKPRDKQLEQKIKEFLKKDYDWNFDIDTTLEQVELTLKRKLQETLSNEYNRINTLELIDKEKTTLKEYIKTKDNHTNFLLKIKVGNLQENITLTLKLINIKQSDQVVFTEIKNFLKQEFDLDIKFNNSIVETLEKLNQKIQDKFKNEKIKITLTKKTNLKWNDFINDRNYFGVSSTDKKGYFMVNIQVGNIQETNFKITIINIK